MTLLVYSIFVAILAIVNAKSVKNYKTAKHELEEYILNKKKDINPRYRLHYHVMPPVGWMNDPNGFSYIKGEYHLFYQFYPYDSVWGPMHWGHVTSPDLVHWKHLPTALLPEEELCFSGCAISDGDQIVLMYTGHRLTNVEPYFNESQYLAFSRDGINFDKYDGNPVLGRAPNGSPDFRDPKIWRYGDHWYVVLGSQTDDQRGRALLYKSEDLMKWQFLNVLAESKGDTGYMWECPDFFELGGKFILLMSPQGIKPQGDRYRNYYQNGYIIGNFSYDTNVFLPEVPFQEIDYGHDFYAAQTTAGKDGKRYTLAWFSKGLYPNSSGHPEDVDGWAGALTIVREMKLVNNRIHMKPVDEMMSLRVGYTMEAKLYENDTLQFGQAVELFVDGSLDYNINLQLTGRYGGGRVWLRWNPDAGKVIVDRGSDDVRQVKWEPIGSHSWRIFLDTCSLELFCGEGEAVFSSRVYPLGGWKLTNLSPQTVNILAYNLRRSVPE